MNNSARSTFLFFIGVFWIISGGGMLITGYWEELRQFAVSERFFTACAYLALVLGIFAVPYGLNMRFGKSSGHS